MAWTVASAFQEFEARLQLTPAQNQQLQTKVNTAHQSLASAFPTISDMPLLQTKLIGSAAHGTIIRPVDDADLMAVFDDTSNVYENRYQNNSQLFIQRIRQALGQHRTQVTLGVRGQAVRLFYQSGGYIDIVPAFKWNAGGYIIPSGTGSWLRTDPDVQAAWFSQQHQQLGYQLIPMIQLLKRWNNEHGKQLRSYHLGVVTANTFGSLNNNRSDAVAKFFAWAPNYLDAQDPAGHSGALSSYLSVLGRVSLVSRLTEAARRANNALLAEAGGNHREAIRLWSIEFGTEFPTYG